MLKDKNGTKELIEDKSMVFNNFHDIFKEFIENEMDDIISNKTLRNIPVLDLVESAIQTSNALWRTNLLKQTATFISEFNSHKINQESLEKYRKSIKNDKNKKEELERVMLILNRNIDIEKSKILARIFCSYINEEIEWELFCEFTDITERLFLMDLESISLLSKKEYVIVDSIDYDSRFERIHSLGLTEKTKETFIVDIEDGEHVEKDIILLNYLGKLYTGFIEND